MRQMNPQTIVRASAAGAHDPSLGAYPDWERQRMIS